MLNFDRFAIAPAFTIFGEAATYNPPAGSPLSCRVIREGGGRPFDFGPVRVYLSALSFDVRAAEVSVPAPGGVFEVGEASYTITGTPFHPEEDAHGHVWCCPVTWGTPIGFRSVIGSGSTQNPPQGGPWVVSANASAGAGTISIKSTYTVGQLRPGDKAVIGSTTYTVMNSVSAVSNVFTGVALSPALTAPAAINDPVTLVFARDYTVLAGVAGYDASQLLGGIAVGDRRVVIMQGRLTAAGCTDAPKASDKITFEGRQLNIQTAAAIYEGGSPFVWDLQCR